MRMRPNLLRDQKGAAAAEFALIIGFVVIMVFGVINAGLMFYSFSQLHMSAGNAARWAAIRTTIDGAAPDATAVQARGDALYGGVTADPSFIAAVATCGIQVTATTTFTLMLGVGSAPMPMTATSCYPLG